MPFIEKQDRTQSVEFKAKIRPEVKALVEEYAAFLESETGYVVQEILRKAIASDKEFQRTKKPEGRAVAPRPRLRKAKQQEKTEAA